MSSFLLEIKNCPIPLLGSELLAWILMSMDPTGSHTGRCGEPSPGIRNDGVFLWCSLGQLGVTEQILLPLNKKVIPTVGLIALTECHSQEVCYRAEKEVVRYCQVV